jgi:hypothetical protein
MGNAAARPVILKRGEKDFEPAHGGGSGLQRHNLERARSAMFDALRSTRTISRYVHPSIPKNVPPTLPATTPHTRAQQVRQLRSLVPRSCPRACDRRQRRPFHLYGPLRPAPIVVCLRKISEKKAGAFAGGGTLPCREGRAFLLEGISRWSRRGHGLGLCVPGCADERAAGVCGDDWDAGFDFGPISG